VAESRNGLTGVKKNFLGAFTYDRRP